jgi:hypothetical protein
VYTRAGHLRSGDIHACEQLNHIVFGRGTLTQLRVSLGSRAHTVLWRCSHATRPALFVMPHPPRAANESSYNARITVLFMDFT